MNYPYAEEVRRQLDAAGAFWVYEGDPRKDAPHALLTSPKHSDGYVNVGQFLKDHPVMRTEFAGHIIDLLREGGCCEFNRVAGADTSSTALAGDIASLAGVNHIQMIKVQDEWGKRQVWSPDNVPLKNGELILHIEELITTASSALQVREGIRRANPGVHIRFHQYLPTVVERSDPDNRVQWVEQSLVLPLLQLSIRNYDPTPESCPYCAIGSEAIKPKENWARLTGKA